MLLLIKFTISLGSVELLKETSLSDVQLELVETIASANDILLTLIEDVLMLVRLEHEKQQTNDKYHAKYSQVFSLGRCVRVLENIIKSYSTQFNVRFQITINEETSKTFVNANQPRIHQIISNLLTNAVKASRKNDIVELGCYALERKRTIDGVTEQDIVFKVSDHGIGIPESKQKTIFEPFSQLHNVNESIYPG